jgi:hypothetical protein
MLRRRARAGERGQTLILALSFLAFFALVAASVLSLASAVESQRGSTEKTAAIDSVAEGSGQFAMSDSGYQPCGATSPGGNGTVNFPATIRADTLTYTIPAGSAGCTTSSIGGNAAGTTCELCILNSSPNSSTPAYGLTTPAFSTNKGITVAGEIDSNGNISGTVTSTGTSKKIGLWQNATCSSCTPSPTHLATPFLDPLAGTLLNPSNGASAQSFSSSGGLIHPGVYSSITVQPGTVWMTPGVYIATGPVSVAGAAGDLRNTDASSGNTTDSDSGGAVDSDSGGASDSNSTADSGGPGTTYTATTLVDPSKTWALNQWAGATVTVTVSKNKTVTGIVSSNVAKTLTIGSWIGGATPVSGSAYIVSPISYAAKSLTDSSKNWAVNQWQNDVVTVTPSGGTQETDIVVSNTAKTLTMKSNWPTTPTSGDGYVLARIGYTATTLVDGFKSWTTNQWQGDVVVVNLAGAQEAGFVASNDATTLTMNPAWGTTPAGGNGYAISKIGYTTNTLVDGTKTWATNQWAGALVTVTLSNTSTETLTVSSNTSNTLTMSAPWAPEPSPGNAYAILMTTVSYTANTLVDTSKNWIANQWVGAIVTVTLSNGSTETGTVASNTSNTLTMSSPWATTPALGNQYSILAPVVVYLACPSAAPYWSCATAGQSGGSITTSGSGTFAITASATYGGMVVFTDPNLVDPSGGNTISVAGNGGNFGGTVYLPRGSLSIGGGGCCGTGVSVLGRLIVRALDISGNGNAVVIFTGAGPSSSTSTCFYYDASLAGTEANGSMIAAHARFETGCSSAGIAGSGQSARTSIISFAYGNGP